MRNKLLVIVESLVHVQSYSNCALHGCHLIGDVRKKALLQSVANYCKKGNGLYEVAMSLLSFGMGIVCVGSCC